MTGDFDTVGWRVFEADADMSSWSVAALEKGRLARRDPALSQWLQCEGTWFVGLDALPNDRHGDLGENVSLKGAAIDFLCSNNDMPALHPAQLSITYPGYPKPRKGESTGAFRYRLTRDAAHIDGIMASGPKRRRFIRETHAWILGIQLSEADANAAPLVVWSHSPAIIRRRLLDVLSNYPPEEWSSIDVTDAYHSARREVFDQCPRVELPMLPGQAVIVHRLALHGVAPWQEGATATPDGRMIAYFRPPMSGGIAAWLGAN